MKKQLNASNLLELSQSQTIVKARCGVCAKLALLTMPSKRTLSGHCAPVRLPDQLLGAGLRIAKADKQGHGGSEHQFSGEHCES